MLPSRFFSLSRVCATRSFATSLKDISIKGFFAASNYAIVGASTKPGSFGHIICENYRRTFKGETFYVNPKGGELFGKPIYKTALDIPQNLEAAVIVVSVKYALQSAEECMKKGAKYVIMIPGGFKETKTEEGRKKQEQLVDLAHKYNCRVLGPNCMGVYDPTQIDTLFVENDLLSKPGFGPVGIFSQSGAIASAILNELAGRNNDGWISKFISFGNACDVNEIDILKYFSEEPSVQQAWSYLEGFRDGPAFMKIAKELSRKKPMLVLKANRSASGAKASASHSASLAANDAVCDQLLKNAGVIRCDVWRDLFNIGRLIRYQPLPKGRRIAIVTDAGGMGVLIADAVDLYHMKLGDFDHHTVSQFRSTFPAYYQCSNPMDLTGSAKTDDMIKAGHLALNDPNVDVVIMGLQPIAPGFEDALPMAKRLTEHFGPGKTKKPFLIVEFGGKLSDDRVLRTTLKENGMAVYGSAEEALRGLDKLMNYVEFLEVQKKGVEHTFPSVDIPAVNSIIRGIQKKGRKTLTEIEGYEILHHCGIETPAYQLCTSAKEAGDFAMKLLSQGSKKLVAKVVSPDIIHKTDVGGVSLNLSNVESVCEAVSRLHSTFSGQSIDYHGILVSEMVPKGLEMMLGANRDATFGPITVSGLGGVMVEVLKDVVFTMCPVSQEDALLSLKHIKNERLIGGFRGQPALNQPLFSRYISAVSQVMAECPEIAEIDINPLIQTHEGSLTAVDSVFKLKSCVCYKHNNK